MNNQGWNLPRLRKHWQELHESMNLHTARVDGCSHGMKGPKGKFLKKPWKINTTSKSLARALERRCPGDHEHEECLGHNTARNSGFYPQSMCDVIQRVVGEMMAQHADDVFPTQFPVISEEEEFEWLEEKRKFLAPLTDAERKQSEKMIANLHRKTGHPSNTALSGCLRHRGAHPEVIELAKKHQCSECQELRAAPLNSVTALERSETLWETVVMDNMQFTTDGRVFHYMVMVDEASRLTVAHKLFDHGEKESRNATGPEVVYGLEETWIRHYGLPAKIRLDPEGAFRSSHLGLWAEQRGVEVLPCVAEMHGQIGVVERGIQSLKATIRKILQEGASDVWQAVIQSCQTFNEFERVAGFSPFQWAFGRQPTLAGRLHEHGFDDPLWTSMVTAGTEMCENLRIRIRAQKAFLKHQSQEIMSRAYNSKTRTKQNFLPGDLVYFKRIKPPAQTAASVRLAHKLWRWYGPGRVLASETRTDARGLERRPSNVIWIVVQGRLKRCSPEQLRHASAREQAIAEGMNAPTAAWTFHNLTQTLYTGEYEILDDYILPEDEVARGPPRMKRAQSVGRSSLEAPATPRTTRRSSSLPRVGSEMRAPEDAPKANKIPQEPSRGQQMSGGEGTHLKASSSRTPKESERSRKAQKTESAPSNPGTPGNPVADLGRIIRDPSYNPEPMAASRNISELFEQPLFKKQRRQLATETEDDLLATSFFASSGKLAMEDMACMLEIDLPETSKEWRRFKRSPEAYFVKKVRSTEVKWHQLDETQKAGFKIAKEAEVSQWLQAGAVRKALGKVPRDRLIQMRWVLTYKETGAPKGRIVLIGYQDPDLASISSAAPTMCRRTRQLALQYSSVRSWRILKADVKAAFLQGDATEEDRNLFAVPVPELSDALGLPHGQAVQVIKSCYGLVSAPASWFQCVRKTLEELGFSQSRTDPCLWFLYEKDEKGNNETVGYICSHVDDFLISGCEQNEFWVQQLTAFHNRFKWSPWETNSFVHCGIRVNEEQDGSFSLDHTKYMESIEQIDFQARPDHEPVTSEELTQLRGVLGALQWRIHQSTPLHAARLGQLQSEISCANVGTLKAANKLTREAFQTRHVSTRINQLFASDPRGVCFIGWSDAALANRRDLSSTGGYVIAATTIEMLKGQRTPLSFVSWRSAKLPRKARSSLAAETQALAECDQELMYTRLAWSEFCGIEVSLKEPSKAVKQITGAVVIDARALFDVLRKRDLNSSGAGLKDKFSALEILCLIESLEANSTMVRWVHSDAQLADALTKPLPLGVLHKAMIEGKWTLSYDPDFTSAKRLKKSRRAFEKEVQMAMCSTYSEPFWGVSVSESDWFGSCL